MKIVLLGLLVLLTSCTGVSFNPPEGFYKAQEARINAMALLLNQPLATVDCPSGCNVSIRDPRAASLVPQVTEGTTTGKVAIVAMQEAGKFLTFGVGAYAAVKVVDKIGDRNYTIAAEGDVGIGNTAITNERNTLGAVTGDTHGTVTGDTIDNSDNSNSSDNSTHDNPIDNADNSDNSDNSNYDNPVDYSDNSTVQPLEGV